MKKYICFLFLFWSITQGFGQLNLAEFEQIDSLQRVEKRNVIVFIHTDWCKYCQVMKNKTFKNKEIIKLINEKFYFVDFDAQEKRTIVFNTTTFRFKPNGRDLGIHELAIELGTIKKQLNYPALCILNDKFEIIFQYNNFLNSKDFMLILEKIK